MAWIPSSRTEPDWFADALLGVCSEFDALKKIDKRNWNTKLRHAVKVLVAPGPSPVFAPLGWSMAYLAGANWEDTNAGDWISPLKRFDALLEAAGFDVVVRGDPRFEVLRTSFVAVCKERGEPPSKGGNEDVADNRVFIVFPISGQWRTPDEIEASQRYSGGAVTQRLVNSYERCKKNRDACIAHHGLKCRVCAMDFRSAYGELGLGFIHIHHKIPLAEVQPGYVCNPIEDLVPLCPNCHAMIHRQFDPSDIKGLRQVWLAQHSEKHK